MTFSLNPEDAAALISSVARNNALIDGVVLVGTKRAAWVLMVAFLNINGCEVGMTQDEKFDLVLAVAPGTLELDEIAAIFAGHLELAQEWRRSQRAWLPPFLGVIFAARTAAFCDRYVLYLLSCKNAITWHRATSGGMVRASY